MALKLHDIVATLSGEGRFTGYPTTIIRLFGCNLKCSFCDVYPDRSKEDGQSLSLRDIVTIVSKHRNKHVLITGGEPLIQSEAKALIYELAQNHTVWVETNGSITIDKDHYRRSWSYCMDIKCPSSNAADKNVYANLYNLQKIDEVKFVIANFEDYMFAVGVLKQYPNILSDIIFSPVFYADGTHNGKELVQWMLKDGLKGVRLGLQLHKLIGVY